MVMFLAIVFQKRLWDGYLLYAIYFVTGEALTSKQFYQEDYAIVPHYFRP